MAENEFGPCPASESGVCRADQLEGSMSSCPVYQEAQQRHISWPLLLVVFLMCILMSAGIAYLVAERDAAEMRADITQAEATLDKIRNELGDVYPEDVRDEMREMMERVDADHATDKRTGAAIEAKLNQLIRLLREQSNQP